MTPLPYDINTIRDGLQRRRQQLASPPKEKKPMRSRTSLDPGEMDMLRNLLSTNPDGPTLQAFAARHNLNGNTMHSLVKKIRKEQSPPAAAAQTAAVAVVESSPPAPVAELSPQDNSAFVPPQPPRLAPAPPPDARRTACPGRHIEGTIGITIDL